MGTVQRIIETWKESADYEKALALIETITGEDDSAIIRVSITVDSYNPEKPDYVKSDQVNWSRRFETIED